MWRLGISDLRITPDVRNSVAGVTGDGMASMLEIVVEARSAATRGWDLARRAAFGPKVSANPEALARLIEADIIPRLLLVHRDGGSEQTIAARRPGVIADGIADEFAAATLNEEVGPLLARVETMLAAGIEVETIYIHLLAPAARKLGTLWDDDACDFVDVTMGLWRLQEIVHALGALVPGMAPSEDKPRRALFAPGPGEQHSLGALLVEEFFRRAGWQTWSAPTLDQDELVALVAGRGFDIVGLSISADRHLTTLARTIAMMRRASRNPDLRIIVGGCVFTDRPQLAVEVGADGTAAEGKLAVALANDLLAQPVHAGALHAS